MAGTYAPPPPYVQYDKFYVSPAPCLHIDILMCAVMSPEQNVPQLGQSHYLLQLFHKMK